MAKNDPAMAGGKGMSPRKAMASGLTGDGNFGAQAFPSSMAHPDAAAGVGRKMHLADSARGAPPGVHHTKGKMPAQAAPDHGPHNPGGYGDHFRREPKA